MGNLYLVTTPIGNLSEMSLNAIEILKMVDVIACEDTRNSIVLLNHYNIKKKLISYHKFNEYDKSNDIIDMLKDGNDIAIITDAGVPSISDPGYILVKKCIDNNIDVYGIGINCALINALIISGFDSSTFAFYGFLSRNDKEMKKQLSNMLNNDVRVAIIYESPKRILKTLIRIEEVFNNPNIVVCNDLTKKFERKYYGEASDVILELENNDKHELGEYVIVIELPMLGKKIINDEISIEALLVDTIKHEKCSLKEAIKIVSSKYDGVFSKNDIYDASLNLKDMFRN